jgi:hypothetical protein
MLRPCLALIFGLLLFASEAAAQGVDDASRAAARQLGYSGVEAYQAGDYAPANDKLDKAYRTLQLPTLGLWSARAMVMLGKLVEGSERYREVQRLNNASEGDAAVQRKAQADAAAELQTLLPRVPALVVQVQGARAAEVSLTIDGVAVASSLIGEPRPVNPGPHAIEGARGTERATAQATLHEGERKTVTLSFSSALPAESPPAAPPPVGGAPAPAPPVAPPPATAPEQPPKSSPLKTIGWIGIGVGGAALVASGVTALLALGKKGDLDDSPNCVDGRCSVLERDPVDGYASLRTISTVSFYAGVALAAAGTVLLVSAPSGDERGVSLRVGPGAASLHGRF